MPFHTDRYVTCVSCEGVLALENKAPKTWKPTHSPEVTHARSLHCPRVFHSQSCSQQRLDLEGAQALFTQVGQALLHHCRKELAHSLAALLGVADGIPPAKHGFQVLT